MHRWWHQICTTYDQSNNSLYTPGTPPCTWLQDKHNLHPADVQCAGNSKKHSTISQNSSASQLTALSQYSISGRWTVLFGTFCSVLLTWWCKLDTDSMDYNCFINYCPQTKYLLQIHTFTERGRKSHVVHFLRCYHIYKEFSTLCGPKFRAKVIRLCCLFVTNTRGHWNLIQTSYYWLLLVSVDHGSMVNCGVIQEHVFMFSCA